MSSTHVRASAGFSLIEVLVAIVILAVALLGMAGLTAASMKGNSTAFYRSQATVLADDILDRMRSNVGPARGGQYDIAPGPAFVAGPGTMARFDCEEWVNLVGTALPGGIGEVDVLNGVATIRISWDEGESSFATVSQL